MADKKIIKLSDYKKKKEADAKAEKEKAIIDSYVKHAKELGW